MFSLSIVVPVFSFLFFLLKIYSRSFFVFGFAHKKIPPAHKAQGEFFRVRFQLMGLCSSVSKV